jgi:hypothetical protein
MAAACAACCIGPILSVLGGVGLASAVAVIWIPALALFTLAAAVGAAATLRRRRTAVCRGTGPVDLGMPKSLSRRGGGVDRCAPGPADLDPTARGRRRRLRRIAAHR